MVSLLAFFIQLFQKGTAGADIFLAGFFETVGWVMRRAMGVKVLKEADITDFVERMRQGSDLHQLKTSADANHSFASSFQHPSLGSS